MKIDPDQFKMFEIDQSLYDLQIDGVPVWERIRHVVYRRINQKLGEGHAHKETGSNTFDYIKGLSLLVKNIAVRNPFRSGSQDIIFISTGRRKKEGDGYWWNIYFDPIYENCDLNYMHFENSYNLKHRRPARTRNLRYLDLISYGGKLQTILGVNTPNISEKSKRKLHHIEQEICDRFNVHLDVFNLVRSNLHVRNTQLWMYSQLLDQINPSVAVLTCSYGKETFIEACQRYQIPVVEFQHGIIYPEHFGYSYQGSRVKELFPDYLLVWGDFWKDSVDYPIPDDHVITVGYPYLEQRKKQYKKVESKEQILFISQGTIGKQLSKFAVEVNKDPSINHNIVYKLHPGEYDRWQKEYPWLIDADFKVIDDSDPPLYQLFAKSSVQVGVGSTALYEGLCFDLDTYLYDCTEVKTLQALLDNGTASLVSSTDELESSLGQSTGQFDQERFFAPDATDRVCKTLQEIVSRQP